MPGSPLRCSPGLHAGRLDRSSAAAAAAAQSRSATSAVPASTTQTPRVPVWEHLGPRARRQGRAGPWCRPLRGCQGRGWVRFPTEAKTRPERVHQAAVAAAWRCEPRGRTGPDPSSVIPDDVRVITAPWPTRLVQEYVDGHGKRARGKPEGRERPVSNEAWFSKERHGQNDIHRQAKRSYRAAESQSLE